MIEPKLEGGRLEGDAKTAKGLEEMIAYFAKALTYPVKVKIDECGSTLDYKALLMGFWFPAMAEQFTARDKTGKEYTAKDMHSLMCHKFFGYTERRTIGRTVIEPALITLTYPEQKTRGDLYAFCRNIELWCSEVGVTLPEKDSDYSNDKAKEVRAA